MNKYVYWSPRILSIIFICFLALFSLDVFSSQLSIQQIAVGLFMHNIPVFILLAFLIISWKYEIVGGIVFILAGSLYVLLMLINMLKYPVEGYIISYIFIIAGPAFLIGTLFIINWLQKKQRNIINKKLLKDTLGWGILLWLTGYLLGIVFFMLMPPALIGWVIMPIGTVITIFVLLKKIQSNSLKYYLYLGLSWTLIAIVFDYFFLVKLFNPADGYYKLDVYLYYVLTFVLPLVVGWKKAK